MVEQTYQLADQCSALVPRQWRVLSEAEDHVIHQATQLQLSDAVGPDAEDESRQLLQLRSDILRISESVRSRFKRARNACNAAVYARLSNPDAWDWQTLQSVTELASSDEQLRNRGAAAAHLYAAAAAVMVRLGKHLSSNDLYAWLTALRFAVFLNTGQREVLEATTRAAAAIVAEVARTSTDGIDAEWQTARLSRALVKCNIMPLAALAALDAALKPASLKFPRAAEVALCLSVIGVFAFRHWQPLLQRLAVQLAERHRSYQRPAGYGKGAEAAGAGGAGVQPLRPAQQGSRRWLLLQARAAEPAALCAP